MAIILNWRSLSPFFSTVPLMTFPSIGPNIEGAHRAAVMLLSNFIG
jgi:hypothetical protein